jgi:EmrB/QacA subfamily drug resistance transporter
LSSQASQAVIPRRTVAVILGGLLTGLLLGFLDITIVATAGPTIISDLGGVSLYAWVFSAFIIVQTVVIPVFGKMSDLYGRKRFFLIGLAVFMAGSILSGASQSIYELIFFRAIQGVGFGIFVPSTIAVAGDLFPPEKRARVQGLLFSVNGIAFAVAPAAGSYLTEALNWRWIFYVNLPVGIVSFAIIFFALKESKITGGKSFSDWGGATSLGLTLGLFLLALSLGGSTFAWYSWQEISVFVFSALSLAGFVVIERKAADPVLPLRLFRKGAIPAVSIVNILRSMILFGLIAYMPLYAQAVLNGSVSDVRNAIYAFTLPVTVGTLLSGNIVSRIGIRNTILAGVGVLVAGLVGLHSINSSSTLLQLMEVSVPLGLGNGMMIAPTIAGFQNSVARSEIGVGSALSTFTLNLGGAIGVSVLGAIQSNILVGQLSGLIARAPPSEAATLSDPNAVGQILASPPALARIEAANPAFGAIVPALRSAFSESITGLFFLLLGVGVVLIAASLLVKKVKPQPVIAPTKTAQEIGEVPMKAPIEAEP